VQNIVSIGIKPTSTKCRAEWFYTSYVATHFYLWIQQTKAEKHCPCFSVHLSGEKPNGKKSLAARFNPFFSTVTLLNQPHKTKAEQHGPCFIII
jgi:hypothetical protein